MLQFRRPGSQVSGALEGRIHNRSLGVSTLRERGRRGKPEITGGRKTYGKHVAPADIHESIAGMKYYRERFIRL